MDLINPSNSRMVQKIQEGHEGFPVSLSTDLQSAIAQWAANLGGAPPPAPTIQLTATFSSIHQLILLPKCATCHNPNGTRRSEDYSTYSSTINTGGVAIGNAAGSALYDECASGSMPEQAPTLSSEELTAIRDWINAGALND